MIFNNFEKLKPYMSYEELNSLYQMYNLIQSNYVPIQEKSRVFISFDRLVKTVKKRIEQNQKITEGFSAQKVIPLQIYKNKKTP